MVRVYTFWYDLLPFEAVHSRSNPRVGGGVGGRGRDGEEGGGEFHYKGIYRRVA